MRTSPTRSRSLRLAALLTLLMPAQLLAQQGDVRGTVHDSLTGRPFAGASVQLLSAATPWEVGVTTLADSSGRYAFTAVKPGRYLLGFLHPRLDSLGFDAVSRSIEVPAVGDSKPTDLALPSAATLATGFCGARTDTTGVVLGRVRDAATGAPSERGEVVVEWGEMVLDSAGLRPTRGRVRSAIGGDGRFVACGVPTSVPVLLRARVADSAMTASSGTVEVSFAPDQPLLHRDLFLAAAELVSAVTAVPGTPVDSGVVRPPPRGTASIDGRVFAPGGQALAGARVRLRDTRASDAYVTTDSAGRFRMSGLPSGTFPIEVIALGFTPTSAPVDLRPSRTTQATVTISARVASLEAVTVYSVASRAAAGFEKRRLQKRGYFLTGNQVRARRTLLSFVLLSAPSLRMTSMRFGRPVVGGFGNCQPFVYLDGFPVMGEDAEDLDRLISTREIGGVEVYTNSFEAPAEFGRTMVRDDRKRMNNSECASIVLWSRMLVP